MNILIRFCVIISIVGTLAQTSVAAQQDKKADSAAVAELVHDWLHALISKDVKALERIMADDFITTNTDGSVNTKEQEIAPFRSPDLKFDTASLEEVHITIHGTTAIVRGLAKFTGKAKWGSFSSRERFTDVFLNRNGKWQVVSSHSSAMRKK